MKVLYVGCFVDKDKLGEYASELGIGSLEQMIEKPHITFAYKPTADYSQLYGTEVHIYITGYANDGRNEGFSVDIETDNDKLMQMFRDIGTPHITISIAEGAKAFDTGQLKFEQLKTLNGESELHANDEIHLASGDGERIYILRGIFGAYMENGSVVI